MAIMTVLKSMGFCSSFVKSFLTNCDVCVFPLVGETGAQTAFNDLGMEDINEEPDLLGMYNE